MHTPGNPIENDPEMKRYFESLPKYLQETLLQSGVEVTNLQQLTALVNRFR